MDIKPQDISVYAKIPLGKRLNDLRAEGYGDAFGRVEDVCRQYGIKYKQLDTCVEFYAPKTRLQYFVEKLHFARVQYSFEKIP